MAVVIVALAFIPAINPALPVAAASQRISARASTEDRNRSFIRQAFDRWTAGKGNIFDLLADDVTWHIAGLDPAVARTYRGREALLDGAVRPLAARLVGRLRPTVRRIWADGDDVIVHWDGAAEVYDGSRYRNTYLWVLTIRDRRIVAVTAFLDNAAFKAVLDKPAPDPSHPTSSHRP